MEANKKVASKLGNIFIGIDPDIKKSGFALSIKGKFAIITSLPFWELIDKLKEYSNARIVLEAGWLINKSNWHGQYGVVAERIAKNVGENHAAGKLIEEFLTINKYDYELKLPLGTKNINAKIFKRMSGWNKNTNQDSRDAAMLIIGR